MVFFLPIPSFPNSTQPKGHRSPPEEIYVTKNVRDLIIWIRSRKKALCVWLELECTCFLFRGVFFLPLVFRIIPVKVIVYHHEHTLSLSLSLTHQTTIANSEDLVCPSEFLSCSIAFA